MKARALLHVSVCAALVAVAFGASAQNYPTRPIRMLIPFPPGGGADISGRLIGRALGERWGAQFVIDNRPGASTIIATEITAKANPDGYTLLMSTGTHTINPSIFLKRPFDEVKDFTPIVLVSNAPNMIAINPNLPVKSIPDLIAWAKANPGKATYGSGGHGTHQHMAIELFRVRAGIDMPHISYKGGVPAINDAIGGQIAMASVSLPALAPYVRSGRLRALGVTSAKRSTYMPEVPTIAEQGFPGLDVNYWLGLMGPAKMPPAIVKRYVDDVNAALQEKQVRDLFVNQGAEPAGGTQQQFIDLINREIKEWAEVSRKVGIKAQ